MATKPDIELVAVTKRYGETVAVEGQGGDEEAAASVALDFGALLDAEPADAADAGHGGAAPGSAGPVAFASLAPLVPPRPRTHWDVLLEENKWLAGVSASPPPCLIHFWRPRPPLLR